LDIGFIDYVYTRPGPTGATADLHSSQITTAPAELSQPSVSSPAVPWQELLTVKNLQLHALKSVLPHTQLTWLPQLSSLKLLGTDTVENLVPTVYLWLRVDSLPWERV
jgi:hypothetical protein